MPGRGRERYPLGLEWVGGGVGLPPYGRLEGPWPLAPKSLVMASNRASSARIREATSCATKARSNLPPSPACRVIRSRLRPRRGGSNRHPHRRRPRLVPDIPRRRAGACPDLQAVPARRCVHPVRLLERRHQGAVLQGRRVPHLGREQAAADREILPVAVFPLPVLDRAVRRDRLRPGDLLERRFFARRADAAGPAASLLRPQPGPLCLGRAILLSPAGAAGLRPERACCSATCCTDCALGTPAPPMVPT